MNAVATLCAALAAIVLIGEAPGPGRLRAVLAQPPVVSSAHPPVARSSRSDWWRSRHGRSTVAACAFVTGWTFVGGSTGVVLGAVLAGVVWFGLGRLESPARAREREHIVAQLPLAADLLATAIAAGCPPLVAVEVVGTALAGPLGRSLAEAAAETAVGADPARAWRPLLDRPAVRPLARTLVAAFSRGTAPGPALHRTAADARAAAQRAGEARARALGARAAAPLGLCFLPAFVLLGVVPIVATSGFAPF